MAFKDFTIFGGYRGFLKPFRRGNSSSSSSASPAPVIRTLDPPEMSGYVSEPRRAVRQDRLAALARINSSTAGPYGLPAGYYGRQKAARTQANARRQAEARTAMTQAAARVGSVRGGPAARLPQLWARNNYAQDLATEAALAEIGRQQQAQAIGQLLQVGSLDLGRHQAGLDQYRAGASALLSQQGQAADNHWRSVQHAMALQQLAQQRRSGQAGALGSVAGGVGGMLLGGPAGALIGAGLGGTLGQGVGYI